MARPLLPDPEMYGWRLNVETQLFEPVMTHHLPAPASVIELSMCAHVKRVASRIDAPVGSTVYDVRICVAASIAKTISKTS